MIEMGKKVEIRFWPSMKTEETFVFGEHMPTRVVIEGGTPTFLEIHWGFRTHAEVNPALPFGVSGPTGATNFFYTKSGAEFNLDQWVNYEVLGEKFEFYYIVKFTDGDAIKSNVLKGRFG
jgi:hypothetical protein